MNEEIMERIQQTAESRPEVMAVYLYGSQTEGGVNSLSDVDLAFLVDEGAVDDMFKARLSLMSEFGRVLKRNDVDVVVLNDESLSLNFQNRVITKGERIYLKSRSNVEDFEFEVQSKFLDFQPVLVDYYRQMQGRVVGGNYASR